jgi:hypothetical protein
MKTREAVALMMTALREIGGDGGTCPQCGMTAFRCNGREYPTCAGKLARTALTNVLHLQEPLGCSSELGDEVASLIATRRTFDDTSSKVLLAVDRHLFSTKGET